MIVKPEEVFAASDEIWQRVKKANAEKLEKAAWAKLRRTLELQKLIDDHAGD